MTLDEMKKLPQNTYIREITPGTGCWVLYTKPQWNSRLFARYVGCWSRSVSRFIHEERGLESEITSVNLRCLRICTEAEVAEIALNIY